LNEFGNSWKTYPNSGSIAAADGIYCGPNPILVEHIIASGLCIPFGGRPKDQHFIFGSCKDAVYKAFVDFINAVNMAPKLAINMPSTQEEWDTIYRQYKRKSTNEIMAGCVACIDGFIQRCNRPTKQEVESCGLNCHACVKQDLQFMYFGVISPGSTNDNISFAQADELKEALSSLPPGLFGLTLAECLLIPITGADRLDPAHDAFNYYPSQLWIRVEMAFGRLVKKCWILGGKVGGSTERVSAILTTCARLYNFNIREDGPFEVKVHSVQEEKETLGMTLICDAPLGMSYLPVVPDNEFEAYPGISQTREAMVDHICEYDIRRPLHNIARQRQEQMENVVVSPDGNVVDREFVSPL
ncbi:hypothetical protein ACHAW6_002854, partial [Cyclotella cf. meneghiniana]